MNETEQIAEQLDTMQRQAHWIEAEMNRLVWLPPSPPIILRIRELKARAGHLAREFQTWWERI